MRVKEAEPSAIAQKRKHCPEFELPEDLSEDDEILLTSILTALCSLNLCSGYNVRVMPPNAFIIRGTLHGESFEVDMEDLQFIHTASPLRIQRILFARCNGGSSELVVKVLNSKQRIMLTDSTTFYVSNRRRKAGKVPALADPQPPLNRQGSIVSG